MQNNFSFSLLGLLCLTSFNLGCMTRDAGSENSGLQKFEVRAHRGGRADRPQNILPAFESGIKSGADSLELDIMSSKNGVLVVSHDPDIHQNPCREKDGTAIIKPRMIIDMNLSEIKSYDCGSIREENYPKQKLSKGATIPTLNEVFDLLEQDNSPNSPKIKLAIEIKMWPDIPGALPSRTFMAKSLVDLLKQRKMMDRVTVISFDLEVLKEVKRLSPAQSVEFLVEDAALLTDLADPKKTPEVKIDSVLPYWELLTEENVIALHQRGLKVCPWTVNDPEVMKTMLNLGVDGITTDDPLQALQIKKDLLIKNRE